MLKLAYLTRLNLPTSRASNSRFFRIQNANISGYCFYMNPNIRQNFKSALVYF